jgi:hypothetical protein
MMRHGIVLDWILRNIALEFGLEWNLDGGFMNGRNEAGASFQEIPGLREKHTREPSRGEMVLETERLPSCRNSRTKNGLLWSLAK